MHFRKMHFRKMHFSKMHFSKILQIFGGLVLGCIKTKFCKKICVRQHFSSSTRFASFCTAAISKFSQKIGLKKQQFSWKFSKNFANVAKFAKYCQISKISAWKSGRFWKMLTNAYLLAKIGADTAENEQHFAEILPTDALWRRRDSCAQARGVTSAGHSRQRRQRASVGKISAKCCSFSAVSAPIFARKYAFCSIFQNLPDSQAEIFEIWQKFANFATFAIFFAEISLDSGKIKEGEEGEGVLQITNFGHFSSSTIFAYFCTAAISKF